MKSSCLDVAGVVELPLSLIGEVLWSFSKTFISKAHSSASDTGKTVKIAKSVLCKTIAVKTIIFNKPFRAPTIYRQVLIYLSPIYRHQRAILLSCESDSSCYNIGLKRQPRFAEGLLHSLEAILQERGFVWGNFLGAFFSWY